MSNQQIFLIHGGTPGTSYELYIQSLKEKRPKLEWILSRKDWKNELQDQLGSGFDVYLPQMPNKQNAQYEEWKLWFEKYIQLLDDNTVFIGYSLGAIFLVKYLSENVLSKRIKATFLLGTPFDNEGMDKEPLNSFLRVGELKNFEKQAGKLFFYHSEDDFAVPFNHLSKYQKELPLAQFRSLKDRNHFLQAEVPELIIDIKKL